MNLRGTALIALSIVSVALLLPTTIFAALTVEQNSEAGYGENGWTIKAPGYSYNFGCGSIGFGGRLSFPDASIPHLYEYGERKNAGTGCQFMKRVDQGNWEVSGTSGEQGGTYGDVEIVLSVNIGKLDTVDPNLEITSPQNGQRFDSGEIIVEGIATDAISGISAVTSEGQVLSVNSEGLIHGSISKPVGVHTITITAVDNAGRTTVIERTVETLKQSGTDSQSEPDQDKNANQSGPDTSASKSVDESSHEEVLDTNIQSDSSGEVESEEDANQTSADDQDTTKNEPTVRDTPITQANKPASVTSSTASDSADDAGIVDEVIRLEDVEAENVPWSNKAQNQQRAQVAGSRSGTDSLPLVAFVALLALGSGSWLLFRSKGKVLKQILKR